MSETNPSNTIQLICAALSRYYNSLGKNYNKLFSIYCDDCGVEEHTLTEELEQDSPEYCSVVDFDENFPFKKEPKNRPQAVFDILRKCFHNPSISFCAVIEFDQELFQVEQKELEETKKIYKEQCPALWGSGMNADGGFLQILTVGRKSKIDYLQHLVDDYSRDRIKHMNEKNGWSEKDWSGNHKHFRMLNKVVIKIAEEKTNTKNVSHNAVTTGAVISFSSRCVPQLQFKNMIVINDSLESIVIFINSAINFISNLVKSSKTICPFQLDFCIAVGEPFIVENLITNVPIDENDDDDDDDDDGDDVPNVEETKSDFVDFIGDIKEKLEKNKLKYKLSEENLLTKQARIFGNIYNNFVSDNKLEEKDDKTDYLHKKRLIVFIDRRKAKINDEKSSVYMYEAPENCRNVPDAAVPEWFISSSRTCLLPSIKAEDDQDKTPKSKIIGANSHCKGSLITFSFHVKMMDVIKCYLYWSGQVIRFMPQDIRTVLPRMFNMKYGGNQDYIDKNQDLDGMIKEMQKKLVDKEFAAFQESYL